MRATVMAVAVGFGLAGALPVPVATASDPALIGTWAIVSDVDDFSGEPKARMQVQSVDQRAALAVWCFGSTVEMRMELPFAYARSEHTRVDIRLGEREIFSTDAAPVSPWVVAWPVPDLSVIPRVIGDQRVAVRATQPGVSLDFRFQPTATQDAFTALMLACEIIAEDDVPSR